MSNRNEFYAHRDYYTRTTHRQRIGELIVIDDGYKRRLCTQFLSSVTDIDCIDQSFKTM